MFAITGATGKVGGAMARALVAQGESVRVVIRDAAKGAVWDALGCDVALAGMEDAAALSTAFYGAKGVFILPPPEFDPAPGYPKARRVIDAVVAALGAARPNKMVCLSTVGADATQDNLLSQRTLMEGALARLDLPMTFLRPAWFMDNMAWDVEAARTDGVLYSFLQPAGRAIPMVAAKDVGTAAAALIREDWVGTRVVGLTGPAPASPRDIAAAFSRVLNRPMGVEMVDRSSWEALFRSQGMQYPGPRMRMLDGFNEGWIDFDTDALPMLRGITSLNEVISGLVE